MNDRRHLACWVVLLGLGLASCGSGASTEPTGPSTDEASGDEVMFSDEEATRGVPVASPEVTRGEALLGAGNVAEAQRAFEAALAASPTDARAHLNLGLVHEVREDFAAAERDYRAAIEHAPEFAEPHNNLGALLRDRGRIPEAITLFREALTLRPAYAAAALNLALALEDGGDVRQATQAYERAIELAPRDPMPRINLGLLLAGSGQRSAALAQLRAAEPFARDNAAALAGLGTGYRRVGEFRASITALRSAIATEEGRGSAPLHAELALAQAGAGDTTSAEATLARAITLDEGYADAYFVLGSMLASRGSYADAAARFERYLALEPRGPHADEARRRLEAARAGGRAPQR